jgi:hypothetical protein
VTTALLGRVNAEGFLGYWPSVAEDENADPCDRGYAEWLVEAEKLVFSTTLTEAPWERTRVVNAPAADVVAELKATGEATCSSTAARVSSSRSLQQTCSTGCTS